MTNKYALLIGNAEYDDTKLNLKTPVEDVLALEQVLLDGSIGAFDEVRVVTNATLTEMRRALGELFTRSHKTDDMLLFYFSGHGELDENSTLYLVARDTERGSALSYTGLDSNFVANLMNRARSRRQVIILDSCYSGAFGTGAKGSRVGTKNIFEGNGYGRYVLTASDALQLSWEGDRIVEGEVVNSFFTHYLLDGLRTGAADRNGDGLVDLNELYDHIYEGMMTASGKQEPLKFTFNEKGGDLALARSPLTAEDRQRRQLTRMLLDAESSLDSGDYRRAEMLLTKVIETDPNGISGSAAKSLLGDVSRERTRTEAYAHVKNLVEQAPRIAKTAWEAFAAEYEGYDPDGLAAILETESLSASEAAKPKLITNNDVQRKQPQVSRSKQNNKLLERQSQIEPATSVNIFQRFIGGDLSPKSLLSSGVAGVLLGLAIYWAFRIIPGLPLINYIVAIVIGISISIGFRFLNADFALSETSNNEKLNSNNILPLLVGKERLLVRSFRMLLAMIGFGGAIAGSGIFITSSLYTPPFGPLVMLFGLIGGIGITLGLGFAERKDWPSIYRLLAGVLTSLAICGPLLFWLLGDHVHVLFSVEDRVAGYDTYNSDQLPSIVSDVIWNLYFYGLGWSIAGNVVFSIFLVLPSTITDNNILKTVLRFSGIAISFVLILLGTGVDRPDQSFEFWSLSTLIGFSIWSAAWISGSRFVSDLLVSQQYNHLDD